MSASPIRADARAPPTAYFDAMWSTGPDPWDHGGRFYEHRKYALTAAMLRTSHLRVDVRARLCHRPPHAMLAPRAERYLATDRHAACGRGDCGARRDSRPGLRVEQGRIPDDWPDEPFDAVVLSEVLYYLEPD